MVDVKKDFYLTDFSNGRSNRGCRFDDDILFILYKENILLDQNKERFMEKYNEHISDKNIFQTLRLKDKTFANSLPIWSYCRPWDNKSPIDKFISYPREISKNRLGRDNVLRTHSDLIHYESCNKDATYHYEKFLKIKSLVEKNTFIDSYPLPSVDILENKYGEKKWRVASNGNHRAVVAYYNGECGYLARVEDHVNEEAIEEWPNVINGSYSVRDAKKIFNDIFNGNGGDYHGKQIYL